jgi:hypothetical protein
MSRSDTGKCGQRPPRVCLLLEATFRWTVASGAKRRMMVPLCENKVFFTYSRPSSASFGGTFFQKKVSSERASRIFYKIVAGSNLAPDKKAKQPSSLFKPFQAFQFFVKHGPRYTVNGQRRDETQMPSTSPETRSNLAPDTKSQTTIKPFQAYQAFRLFVKHGSRYTVNGQRRDETQMPSTSPAARSNLASGRKAKQSSDA